MLKFEDAVEIIEEGVDAAGPVGEIVETIGETKIGRGIIVGVVSAGVAVGAVIGVVALVKSRSKKNDIDCDECGETNLVVCNECLEEANETFFEKMRSNRAEKKAERLEKKAAKALAKLSPESTAAVLNQFVEFDADLEEDFEEEVIEDVKPTKAVKAAKNDSKPVVESGEAK